MYFETAQRRVSSLHQADVAAKLATVRAQEGNDVSFAVSFTERTSFRYPDGRYQENPSAIAVTALSDAIMDFDIFAVTHQVRCPLLFIGAVEQGGETPNGDEMAESMYLWRKGVQMEFESLSPKYPNIHWAGVPGDHMFILYESVPHRELILHFTGENDRTFIASLLAAPEERPSWSIQRRAGRDLR